MTALHNREQGIGNYCYRDKGLAVGRGAANRAANRAEEPHTLHRWRPYTLHPTP
ncbi:hypothetical protein H6G72_09145 [Planktothricoides sp. FACHB-1370]|uniref:Uncharacterized protein n=1 Tax=Planktothricoides raciborskii FACHB-1370 TaxID=2949576 RepID=A0ABR8ECZ8_9CYAN|nr:hypothetical protein [Planktothricoides raciborskii FACHB-1370]MBD2582488.1 hypothetical protein [Planktothricoides raciborskii FACHB-1261]